MPHLPRPQRPAWASTTTSASARGYGAAWRKLRARKLKANPWCEDPSHHQVRHTNPTTIDETHHWIPADTVDHRIPKAQGGTDAWQNLQSLCTPCHDRKTATDRAKIGRGREGGRDRSPRQPQG